MAKVLATLKIILDAADDPSPCNVSCLRHNSETGEHELHIAPEHDLTRGATPKDLAPILAHELGHFVAAVAKTPAAQEARAENYFLGAESVKTQVKEETEAWKFGEEITPAIKKNTRIKKFALKSYGAQREALG